MEEKDMRTAMLIGTDALDKLKRSRVAVFGLGGVGGHATEALVRAGISELELFDNDVVSESNLNRQLFATVDSVGLQKTVAAEKRIKSIRPDCKVTCFPIFVTPEIIASLDLSKYDYIVDAIDTVSSKIALAEKAFQEGIPIISAMGAGNKLDPTRFEVSDIYSTSVCPLARVMRAELKKRGVKSLKVVYSKEEPRKPIQPECISFEGADCNRRSTPASISFVPSAVGLIIASEVVRDIIS